VPDTHEQRNTTFAEASGSPSPELHLYINTLMLQQVLAAPQWSWNFTARDLKALTPLIWEHVNPCGRYLDFYNRRRPHSSLDGMTPDCAYFTPLPIRLAA
jgi:hypothetical protein